MQPHFRYLRYVLKHKWFVLVACLRIGGLRLLWRGLIHDWSKFLPSEWFPYVDYFYGEKRNSSAMGNRYGYCHQPGKPGNREFDLAWNYHLKRNDHHWQYWLVSDDNGDVYPLPMPAICREEMLADWIGAGRALGKPDTRAWYTEHRHEIQLHPETRKWIEQQLHLEAAGNPEPSGELDYVITLSLDDWRNAKRPGNGMTTLSEMVQPSGESVA